MCCVMYAFPRRSVGTRNGQCNVCIPMQERGNEKIDNIGEIENTVS